MSDFSIEMEVEQVRDATTPEQMRAEFFRLARYDSMVRAVMDTANYNGLSAEDKYTLLAYSALRDRASAMKQVYDFVIRTPMATLPISEEKP